MKSRPLHTARFLALRALERVSLLEPTYRLYERVRSRGAGVEEDALDTDGLPVPPPRLRTVIAGTPGLAWFLESGRQQAAIIREALERHGSAVDDIGRLLDFGCGCGRVTRHWSHLDGPAIHGTDYNAELVGWCGANLPFAAFTVNGLQPPVEYESGSFDAVYAVSVFTHLPEDLERAWVAELRRILRPGGLLVLTTHGDSYADRLEPGERTRYLAGEAVVRWASVAGTNLCTTFHPEPYVRERFAPELDLREFVPEGGTVGSPRQDLAVFSKP